MAKDLFRKAVVTVSNDENNNIVSQNLIGYVAKDTDDLIVVFSEFDGKLRFDIPKSIISVSGNSVIIDNKEALSKYTFKRDDPLPQGKNLRPSAEEISGVQTRVIEAERREVKVNKQQPEPIKTIKEYKTPVQAPVPSPVAQPSSYQTSAPRVKNVDTTSSIPEKDEQSTGDTTPKSLVETTLENEDKTTANSEPLTQDKAMETLVEPQSEPLTQDKAAAEGKQSLPTAPTREIEKEVVAVTNLDRDVDTEPLEMTGLDSKNEQQWELPVPEIGASKETNLDNFDILSGGDYLYPFSVSMALWQDFALAGIHMYNEFAREYSKINGYWLNIFWNAWSEGSGSDKNE